MNLVKSMEELMEIVEVLTSLHKNLSKALRFGVEDIDENNAQLYSNRQRLEAEIADALFCFGLLIDKYRLHYPTEADLNLRAEKYLKYNSISRALGRLK